MKRTRIKLARWPGRWLVFTGGGVAEAHFTIAAGKGAGLGLTACGDVHPTPGRPWNVAQDVGVIWDFNERDLSLLPRKV